ncbi:MAG TPA: hypothetical protein VM452_04215 [Caulifigura sp.]|jgi:hypothetical protein|nr:hypothetical protein [Caulifigura sp.]
MRGSSVDSPPESLDESATSEELILVAGHLDAWWCWSALGLAVIFAVVAGIAFVTRHPLRFGVTAMAVLAAIAAVIGFGWQFFQRKWLTWTADSLEVHGRTGRTEVLDSEIEALAVTRDYRHAVGRIVAEAHYLSLWVGGPNPQVLSFEARSPLGGPAPFDDLVDRLQGRLERRALETIRREGEFVRPGWTWRAGQILAKQGSQEVVIPLASLSAVDNDIVELRLWVDADPSPAVRLGQSGRDVWLLGRMLESAVGAPGDPGVAAATGLGRILHESRPRSSAIMATMLCGLSAAIALFAIITAAVLRLTPLAILGAGAGMGAIMLGSTARRLWQCVFRLHEAGISQRGLTGDRALRFHDISQFVFDARRQYSKGRYLGTLFTMVFASDEQPKQGILHSERCAYETDEIAGVRDRVSEEIAAGMAGKLAASGELVWTRELAIRGGVLHCEPRRFMGWAGKSIQTPIDSIRGYEVTEGWFYVWTAERERPLFKARTAEANFFPGLLIFEQLVVGTEAQAAG